MQTREIRFVRRPEGLPRPGDFALVSATLPEPGPGQALVQNVLMSVDPYVRLHLDSGLPLGSRLIGGGVGRVLSAAAGGPPEGALVRHRQGFAERFVCDAAGLVPLDTDPDVPLEAYLSTLGGIGLCAYGGLLETGQMKSGEEVFVSAAAGAVGCLAVQIARIKGCRVVGSTGSAAKAAWLRDELGLDAVIDYKARNIGPALAQATPGGLDVYFENVGGAHFQAALERMNLGGRIAVCGMISTYNNDPQPVTGLEAIVVKRLAIRGFGFIDFPHLEQAFQDDMKTWMDAGLLKRRETILEGIERAPEAFIGLFEGRNVGKMLLRI
jgi:NADPH-dependent curcumin reductase CurA